jgi:hypothetical protein
MTCRELERLLSDGASESEQRAHRDVCRTCEALGTELDETERITSDLRAPAWSGVLREALLATPAKTVSCGNAAMLMAAALEPESTEISAPDRSRLDFHLSRCEGCREAWETLGGIRELELPRPAPWMSARLSAARPERARARWRGLLDPRAAIGFAYAAALVVMLAGFNPADIARAGASLRSETKTAAVAASGSVADRLGGFQDRASRAFAVWRGRAGGYGRAVLSNAISLVMKSDETNRTRPPSRPRNGEDRAPQKNENETAPTWRA